MKVKRSFISILLCLALLFTSVAAIGAVQATAASTEKKSTGNSNTGELVLKAWNWPISVIEDNLDEIADAGFTVIETSAVNGIVGSGNSVTDWYQFYQPTNYSIGNKIGTEAEFKTLCSNANAKGIKIIVDVVLNHTTDQTSMVDSSLQHWHSSTNTLQGDDYNDRYKVTQWRQSGMPDLDTSRSDIQSAANTFLKRMISDGASGFRFDAAKHIELPSQYDGSYGCASDYWPNALNGVNATFMYGEVLGGTNANEYMNYMKITDSGYSGNVRSAIQSWNLPASTLTNYDHSADPDYLVNYVETHDNFVDGNYGMSNFQLQLAWAAIAAMGNNCMYLARPYGSTSSYTSGGTGYKGSNNVYDGGDGAYLLPQVAEVNKFHNAMSGKATYVSNINNNTQVVAVRRGTDGICIINAGASAVTFSGVYTGMANGTYKDTINNTSFTVSNGYMSGTVNSGQIYPIYNSSSSSEVSLSDCYLHGWIGNQDYTGTDYHFNSSGSLTATFASDSYVYINANGTDYKTASYVSGSSGSFYAGNTEKMYVPAGTATFTLTKSGTGFNLSYTTSGGNVTEPTSSGGTTSGALYLNASYASTASPKWYIWTWGTGSGRAVQGTLDSTSGYYKFTDYDSNVIFLRVDPSSSFDGSSWSNPPVWNKTDDLTVPSGKNLFTIDGWLTGTWGTYTEPTPTYDYTVNYIYEDYNGNTNTITRTVEDSELTDAGTIAALNDPSGILKDPKYSYSIGSASKSDTTITAYLTKTEKKYTVNLNGTKQGEYSYMDQATITNSTATGFLIDGNLVKYGNAITFYVTGNVEVTTDASATHEDTAILTHNGTYLKGDTLSLELLATANVEDFNRMGVAFSLSSKTNTQIAAAVNSFTTLGSTKTVNGIGVHNSNVDWPNSSGQYQFRYAPYMSISKIPSGSSLYFYTFAATDNAVVISDAVQVQIASITA
ncbi:MAG: hypothetical protein IJT79_06255 [Ruminococcus sp.]|nr:hypothetical protein [Ruminococcus sp.]